MKRTPAADEAALAELLQAVYDRYQHDFRPYARTSLLRRLQQATRELNCADLHALRERVVDEPATFARLMHYLTVQVSEMFRDPAHFLALRKHVVPELRTYPSIKVWVAGCSTGEELWSLAILLHEEELLARTLFYATDIHPEALRAAEAGVYAADRVAGFSASYLAAGGRHSLADYYTCAYGAATFANRLPLRAVFADHSLATDSVFSEVHLVSCRNVLIYFTPDLQDRALGLFADALVRRGFLVLGSHETVRFSRHAEQFTPLLPVERIYRRC